MNKDPVAIVGGGLAGLTAASFLKRHGIPVRVFEAGKDLAGLAKSERDEDGFTYDCGAHFITNRLAAAVGCSALCKDVAKYGETVHYRSKNYSYPLGLLTSPKFLSSAICTKLTGFLKVDALTVADHYRQAYGKSVADEIANPLTEAWSGVSGSELAASVGQKFSNSIFRTIYLSLMKKITGRTIGIGYCSTLRESTSVWHVYPEGGLSAICHAIATDLEPDIQRESPVEAIHTDGDRVTGIQVRGETIPTQAVISTAPVHMLPKLVQGTDKLDYLKRFQFRAMVFVNIRLDGESRLPDVVTWTPEESFPFFRISDIGMGMPFLVPSGKTQVTCDIGCAVGDATWNASEEDLARRCLESLDRIVPQLSKKYLGCRVLKTPLAYPIFKLEYERDRLRFQQGTGIKGLVSVGRNGEFDHILMEDVYWRTRRKMLRVIEELRL